MEKLSDQYYSSHLDSENSTNESLEKVVAKLHREIANVQLSRDPDESASLDILSLPLVDGYLRADDTNSADILELIDAFDESEQDILIKALTFNNIQELLFNNTTSDKALLALLIKHQNVYIESKIETWMMSEPIFSQNLLDAVLALNWENEEGILDTYLPFIKNIPTSLAEDFLQDPRKQQILIELAADFEELPPNTERVLGFNLAKLASAWRKIKDSSRPFSAVSVEHGKATFAIEKRRPGSVKFLMENYGICDFARYPIDILLEQIDSHEKKTAFGSYFFPRADYNNVLGQDHAILSDLLTNLPNINLKILEVEDTLDLAKKLVFLENRFGPMDYLIIAGHGDGQSIQFDGGDKQRQRLKITDIDSLRENQDRTENFLKPGAPILINSCHAGVQDGIAQAMAKKFNTLVIGPNSATRMILLEALVNDGKITFFPTYQHPDEIKDASRVYYNGKKGNFSL